MNQWKKCIELIPRASGSIVIFVVIRWTNIACNTTSTRLLECIIDMSPFVRTAQHQPVPENVQLLNRQPLHRARMSLLHFSTWFSMLFESLNLWPRLNRRTQTCIRFSVERVSRAHDIVHVDANTLASFIGVAAFGRWCCRIASATRQRCTIEHRRCARESVSRGFRLVLLDLKATWLHTSRFLPMIRFPRKCTRSRMRTHVYHSFFWGVFLDSHRDGNVSKFHHA